MTPPSKRLLVVGVDPEVFTRFPPLLWRESFDVSTPEGPVLALKAVANTEFHLIITHYPFADMEYQEFLDEVRAFGSPCRRSGLLAVVGPSLRKEASGFIGRGLNRVVTTDDADWIVAATIAELLEVAPRAAVRADLAIHTEIRSRERNLITQTVNISRSGMLVRNHGALEHGERFEFSLELPGDGKPVSGEAEVVRFADARREGFDGTGVRFIQFTEDGEERLAAYIDQAVAATPG